MDEREWAATREGRAPARPRSRGTRDPTKCAVGFAITSISKSRRRVIRPPRIASLPQSRRSLKSISAQNSRNMPDIRDIPLECPRITSLLRCGWSWIFPKLNHYGAKMRGGRCGSAATTNRASPDTNLSALRPPFKKRTFLIV